MTQENKPVIFGQPATFCPAEFEPRSGKSSMFVQLMDEIASKPVTISKTMIGNCNAVLPMTIKFDANATGHTVCVGPAGAGMSSILGSVLAPYLRDHRVRVFNLDKGESKIALCKGVLGASH